MPEDRPKRPNIDRPLKNNWSDDAAANRGKAALEPLDIELSLRTELAASNGPGGADVPTNTDRI